MDAKTNANIINAVASGTQVPCPNCNSMNEAESRFCMACGTPLVKANQNIIDEEQAEPVIPVTVAPQTDVPVAPANTVVEPDVPFAPINSDKTEEVPFAPVGTDSGATTPFAQTNDMEPKTSIKPMEHERKSIAPFTPVAKKRKEVAFASVAESIDTEPEAVTPLQPLQNEITTQEVMEAVSAFAEGLPKWDVVPPQVAVRRKKK